MSEMVMRRRSDVVEMQENVKDKLITIEEKIKNYEEERLDLIEKIEGIETHIEDKEKRKESLNEGVEKARKTNENLVNVLESVCKVLDRHTEISLNKFKVKIEESLDYVVEVVEDRNGIRVNFKMRREEIGLKNHVIYTVRLFDSVIEGKRLIVNDLEVPEIADISKEFMTLKELKS